ncbi:hypothetical protein SETIT_4G171300v2 [Setaria italica]|uniref:RING-type E3 ubiquitin transferase n=3 Tax=Setaria italica TaxID=4555 RepID=A0A368QX23_SETIT|nr:hypothetical protein SETIT_4G171300v2 [Setaria italica]
MTRLPGKATLAEVSNAACLVAAACCLRCPGIGRHYAVGPWPPGRLKPLADGTNARTHTARQQLPANPAGTARIPAMSAAAEEYPWRAQQVFGDAMAAQRSALVLASYPVLLLLVILAAFVRYLWVALAMYCALLFVLSCASRTFAARAASDEEEARLSRGGLSPTAITPVAPAFPYEPPAAGAPVSDCAVCLEAMKAGEAARRLPACAHAFHVGCIDMWLDSHATCPVCRCHVVPQKKGGKEPPEGPVQQPSIEPPPV